MKHEFNLNNCIGIRIHTVDGINTGAKVLPCLLVEKVEADKKITSKLVCQCGKLENNYLFN